MSPPEKKQKKMMPGIAGRKARFLPEVHELNGNFNFEGTDKERYQAFLYANIYLYKCVDDTALKQLNIIDKVYKLIDNIGRRKFLEIKF